MLLQKTFFNTCWRGAVPWARQMFLLCTQLLSPQGEILEGTAQHPEIVALSTICLYLKQSGTTISLRPMVNPKPSGRSSAQHLGTTKWNRGLLLGSEFLNAVCWGALWDICLLWSAAFCFVTSLLQFQMIRVFYSQRSMGRKGGDRKNALDHIKS